MLTDYKQRISTLIVWLDLFHKTKINIDTYQIFLKKKPICRISLLLEYGFDNYLLRTYNTVAKSGLFGFLKLLRYSVEILTC